MGGRVLIVRARNLGTNDIDGRLWLGY